MGKVLFCCCLLQLTLLVFALHHDHDQTVTRPDSRSVAISVCPVFPSSVNKENHIRGSAVIRNISMDVVVWISAEDHHTDDDSVIKA